MQKQEKILKEICKKYRVTKPRLRKSITIPFKPIIRLEGTTEYLEKFKWIAKYHGYKVVHLINWTPSILNKLIKEHKKDNLEIIMIFQDEKLNKEDGLS